MPLQMLETTARPPATDADAERSAYNAAFHAVGLDWHWDPATYAELRRIDGERERICAYLRRSHPHLLKAYDADFLSGLVLDAKRRQADGGLAAGQVLAHDDAYH